MSKPLKLTVLVENTARGRGLLAEHGLAFCSVIGGTHLAGASEYRMTQTIKALRDLGSPRLVPVHCTGFEAAAQLWTEFPGRIHAAPVGTRLTEEGKYLP